MRLFRPGSVDLLEGSVFVNGTADVVGHILPEGASANSAGHQVGSVEAEGGRVQDDFGNAAGDRILVPVEVGVIVRGNCATGFDPTFDGFAGGEVLDDCANFGAVIEHGVDVASAENGLAIGGVNRGQVEEVIIYASHFAFGEEGGDEVALAVQPALAEEHRTWGRGHHQRRWWGWTARPP